MKETHLYVETRSVTIKDIKMCTVAGMVRFIAKNNESQVFRH